VAGDDHIWKREQPREHVVAKKLTPNGFAISAIGLSIAIELTVGSDCD